MCRAVAVLQVQHHSGGAGIHWHAQLMERLFADKRKDDGPHVGGESGRRQAIADNGSRLGQPHTPAALARVTDQQHFRRETGGDQHSPRNFQELRPMRRDSDQVIPRDRQIFRYRSGNRVDAENGERKRYSERLTSCIGFTG